MQGILLKYPLFTVHVSLDIRVKQYVHQPQIYNFQFLTLNMLCSGPYTGRLSMLPADICALPFPAGIPDVFINTLGCQGMLLPL
jgi:hypothetical protein